MSALENQPENLNYLSPLGFKFIIKKLPNVNYFCQTVTVPSIQINQIEIKTPVGTLQYPGDKLVYDPLTITFKVDEDLQNYKEIHNWMIGLGHPIALKQYNTLSSNSETPVMKANSAASVLSDGTLVVLTSHKNASHYIKFIDLFPLSLSEITFDSTQSTVEYLQSTVTFKYLRYEIEKI